MSKILVVLTSHDELGDTDRTEDDLRALGGHNKKTGDWEGFTIVDSHLITSQNPASSTAAVQSLLALV